MLHQDTKEAILANAYQNHQKNKTKSSVKTYLPLPQNCGPNIDRARSIKELITNGDLYIKIGKNKNVQGVVDITSQGLANYERSIK